MPNQDNFWLRIIYIVSVVISAAVAFLILGPRPAGIEAGKKTHRQSADRGPGYLRGSRSPLPDIYFEKRPAYCYRHARTAIGTLRKTQRRPIFIGYPDTG